MYNKYFEQILPGKDWVRIFHDAEEIAQERAVNAIKHFPHPYAAGITYQKMDEAKKPGSLFRRIESGQKNKLIGQLIAREFRDSALDINGYNPMDSIPGVAPHLENLHLENLGDPFHKVQGNPINYGEHSLVNRTFDVYCDRDHRGMDIHARVISDSRKHKDPQGFLDNPVFWLPFKEINRSPSEYWLMTVDERDYKEGGLVFITHYFIGRNDFAKDIRRHKDNLSPLRPHAGPKEGDSVGCWPRDHCGPAKVLSPHETENWIRLKNKHNASKRGHVDKISKDPRVKNKSSHEERAEQRD